MTESFGFETCIPVVRNIADPMQSQLKTFWIAPFLIFPLLLFGLTVNVIAVQEDPFGDPFGAGKKQDGKNEDPFGGGAANDPFKAGGGKPAAGAPGTPPPTTALPEEVDNVVLAIRETNPTTPSELMRALRIMFDTQNYQEAKSYLGKLKAAGLDDRAAFALVEEIGSDFVIRLMRSKQMAPEGAAFGRGLMTSASRHLVSDAQLNRYFADLKSESSPVRNRAATGFRRAGIQGLAHLVKNGSQLASAEQRIYQVAAALIGEPVIPPLEAVLESGSPKEKAFSIDVLGRVNSRKSIPLIFGALLAEDSPEELKMVAGRSLKRMLGKVPSLAEARRFLHKYVMDWIRGDRRLPADAFGKTRSWVWTGEGKLVAAQVDRKVAEVLLMQRLGRTLYRIDAGNPEARTMALATQIHALKIAGNRPVSTAIPKAQLTAVPPKEWVGILEFCLKNGLTEGAAAAAEIIGQVGDQSLLRTSGFSPLVKGIEHGNRELRFACTQALIKLDPHRSFPGASRFLDSVVYFAGTRGKPRALVAHPKFSEGQNLVGTLVQRGFEAKAVTTGRDLFRAAAQESDLEFILVSDAIDLPSLGELLPQLRSLPAAARTPIGILSQKINHERNERIAASDKLVQIMKQPYRVSFRVEQLLPEDNDEINNAIITWTVLSDILEQSLQQGNRTVAIEMLETMRAAYNDDLSRLAVDNSAIVTAMKHDDEAIRHRASRLFLRVTGDKPIYEKPIQQPTVSGRVLIVHPRSGDILPLQEKLREVGYTVAVLDSVDRAINVLPGVSSLRFVIGSKELGGLAAKQLQDAVAKKFRLNPTPITFIERADAYRETPVAKPAFDVQLQNLLRLTSSSRPTQTERLEQARVCVSFLKTVMADRKSYAFLNPVRHESRLVDTVRNPGLVEPAVEMLAELATPSAQQALADFASEHHRPLAQRQAAVRAFKRSVEKRGLLLTREQILQQYSRYNQSETLDSGTQKVLGSILDIIESPRGSG